MKRNYRKFHFQLHERQFAFEKKNISSSPSTILFPLLLLYQIFPFPPDLTSAVDFLNEIFKLNGSTTAFLSPNLEQNNSNINSRQPPWNVHRVPCWKFFNILRSR